MSTAILQGDPPVELLLRRSDRARRMTLRVSRLDGRVTLTLPNGVRKAEAIAFAQERETWIRKHVSQSAPQQIVQVGDEIPVLGEMRQIVSGSGKRVVLGAQSLSVPGSPEHVARKTSAFLRNLARSELAFASDEYAAALGKSYSKLTLRDTRSRWGSCTSAGGLMYSWRLIMAPAEVLAYVAAHEVAHLAEMNHSPAFWNTVTRLYGAYEQPKAWLRKNGHLLHQYRFAD